MTNLNDEVREKKAFDYNMFEWTYPGGLVMNARKKYDEQHRHYKNMPDIWS